MCKFNPKNDSRRVDPCMIDLIKRLESMLSKDYKICACCCGHRKYPKTIVVHYEKKLRNNKIRKFNFEFFSGWVLKREKKFYKKDKQGRYYIPECSQNQDSK